jgi:hypothetical protein
MPDLDDVLASVPELVEGRGVAGFRSPRESVVLVDGRRVHEIAIHTSTIRPEARR